MDKLAISVPEAAKLLSISKSTAYSLCEQGILPAIRCGQKRLIVPVRALEQFLEQAREVKDAER